VIDCCTLSAVFDESNAQHIEFAPVRHWLLKGKGKVIYGGTHYIEELSRAPRYLAIFVELRRSKKAIKIDTSVVDNLESAIKDQVKSKKFNDPHLIAIMRASHCRTVCTSDDKAVPFLKNQSLYGAGSKKAKIYSRKKNRKLLDGTCDEECRNYGP
jgi:hypothetical protein